MLATETAPVRRGKGGAATAGGPDFLCIGAQKAGTQWLYDQLSFHPDFWMPPVKELHYFDRAPAGFKQAQKLKQRAASGVEALNRDRVSKRLPKLAERDLNFVDKYLDAWQTGAGRLGPYAGLFAEKNGALTGDITPAYSGLRRPVVRRIAKRFPKLRVVFLARDPVERLVSQIGMAVRLGREEMKVPVTAESALAFASRTGVKSRSFPSRIVARWREALPAGHFGYFFFDDLRDDAAEFRRAVLRFLGGRPDQPSGDLDPGYNRKSGEQKLKLDDAIVRAVAEMFADELRASARDLGGRAAGWPAKYGL